MRGYLLAIWATSTLLASVTYTDACSCMPSHPQTQYCRADFVIFARIKKEYTTDFHRIYKMRIRKEFKMSEKAQEALKYGRIRTALEDSMCGMRLQVGKMYVIAGDVISLKAHVGLCNLVQPVDSLTKRQRKGLKMMYRQGCGCEVQMCSRFGRCKKSKNTCKWTTFGRKADCQSDYGICLRSSSQQCAWVRNAAQTKCMRSNHTNE